MPPRAEVDIPPGTTVVDFATPQSVAVFGQPGIAQDDPDWFAATVLNRVLGGGGFESRLMTEVREKRGLTYGVNSYLAPRDLAETYLGSVSSANDRIAEAIAVIRAENPGLLRLSCVHEELAQGLGLANDYPAARPSIFNDDDEFALLTEQDELMLKMLYDPRLRPGMTAKEVNPRTRIIARELTEGPL